MANIGTRKRKLTSRYGDLATTINSSSERDENFADNSMDDPNYDPLKNKRQRIVEGELLSDDSFTFEENFDEEFEQIEALHVNIENSVDTHNTPQANQPPSPEDSTPPKADSELTLDTNYFRKMLTTLHENSLQILTRIAVIEDSLLKSGNLVTTKKVEAEKTAVEKYYAFSKSHGLPMKTMDEINKFENNLSQAEFEEEAVSSHIHTFQLVQTIDSKKCNS